MIRILFLLCVFAWGTVAASAAPACKAQKQFKAVDLSQPVTTIRSSGGKPGTALFKQLGVKTIARYYDWVDKETTCKSLFPEETDALLAAGFSIITVFQHGGSDPETFFDRSRGTKDAREALKFAGINGQPPGSAIYFAVDGVDQTIHDAVFEWNINKGGPVKNKRKKRLLRADHGFRKHLAFYERFRHYHRRQFGKHATAVKGSDMLPFIERYFRNVNDVMKSDGRYKVGVYGGGATCDLLMRKKLADFCWIAMSSKWPGTQAFLKSGRWSMAQQHTTFCKGWTFEHGERVRFDFNRIKPGDVGQWSKRGKVIPAAGLPDKCRYGW